MSRLIIKNLPSYVTPEKLKTHLSQRDGPGGTLTDVKVARKSDGTSRRFAFVGYKTEEEAAKVAKWFDKTFFDSTRIVVQTVEKGAKDAPTPRPNKRPRTDTPSDTKGKSKSKDTSNPTADKESGHEVKTTNKKEQELEEFMKVMQPRTKKERVWMNEDLSLPGPSSQPIAGSSKNIPDVSPQEAEGDEAEVPEEVDDLEWMKRRMKKSLDDIEEKVFIQDEDDVTLNNTTTDRKPNHDEGTDGTGTSANDEILRSGRLFLRNLSYACAQSDLEALFSRFGTIKQVHIPLDPVTKTTKGLGFVTFLDPQNALRAFEELDKTSFQGRLIHILPAAEQRRDGVQGVEEIDTSGKKSLKSEREKKRKETSNKEFNWSMLYMNADAVASSVADRMNILKSDILNPDSDNTDSTSAAVKLALAETHIIQETKSYLESEGIDLSAFSSLDSNERTVRARRSDTCILVKNIPYGTTVAQIEELFSPFGELSRVLVPLAGTIAVVEYVHPDEAAKGFRSVAYRRMGSSIIYLEKAPLGIFNGTPSSHKKASDTTSNVVKPLASSPKEDSESVLNDEETETAPGSTLYIKNLSFATTSERLTSAFRNLPSFAFARVQTKPDPKRPGAKLSMGFGFVGFTTPDAAKSALKGIQGFILDGHTLSAKFAGRGTEEDASHNKSDSKSNTNKSTTKMIVKNVPFEATKKEIRALFGAHGQLKSVRLPKKFDSRARGFAFLDFATRHEAENAYAALKHTHLLGRHLVLEWADDEGQDIDALRKKAGVGYGNGAELPGRKRKLDLGDDDDMGDD